MNVQHGNVNVVEQLRVVLDAVAAAEKHHDLLLQVLLEKGEEKEEAAVRGADDVSLLNVVGRRDLIGVVDTNVQRFALRTERQGRMSVVCGWSSRVVCNGRSTGRSYVGGRCDGRSADRAQRIARRTLSEMRARSSTLRVCVAEKSMVWRFSAREQKRWRRVSDFFFGCNKVLR